MCDIKKKRVSDISAMAGERLGFSFPSPRSRLSLDGKLRDAGPNVRYIIIISLLLEVGKFNKIFIIFSIV